MLTPAGLGVLITLRRASRQGAQAIVRMGKKKVQSASSPRLIKPRQILRLAGLFLWVGGSLQSSPHEEKLRARTLFPSVTVISSGLFENQLASPTYFSHVLTG